jgi:hypothetical protein
MWERLSAAMNFAGDLIVDRSHSHRDVPEQIAFKSKLGKINTSLKCDI